jgi:hypothetical protein
VRGLKNGELRQAQLSGKKERQSFLFSVSDSQFAPHYKVECRVKGR